MFTRTWLLFLCEKNDPHDSTTNVYNLSVSGWWRRTCSTRSLAASSERVTTPPTSPGVWADSQTSTWRLWAVCWTTTCRTPSTPAAPLSSMKPPCGWTSCARAAWRLLTWMICRTYAESRALLADWLDLQGLGNTWQSWWTQFISQGLFLLKGGAAPPSTGRSSVNPLEGAVICKLLVTRGPGQVLCYKEWQSPSPAESEEVVIQSCRRTILNK